MKRICQLSAILLTTVIMLQGCTDSYMLFESTEDSDPIVLVLSHSQDSTSQQMSNQIIKPLDYAHLPYIQRDVSATELIDIPGSVRVMYLATDVVEDFSDEMITEIVRFVAAGNRLVVMAPVYDQRFSHLIGLKQDAEFVADDNAEGFHYFEHVFPYYAGKKFKVSSPFLHYGFESSQFVADTTVIASAQNDPEYPAILERKIGQGSVIFFNTQVTDEKDYRGLLFSAGLKALEGIPYRIANVSTIFLDDFPAPLYKQKMAPIDKEYDLTHADFVTDVWWPDMKRLADQFDIDYTALLAFNYNAVVVPPFDFQEWENVSVKVDGRNRNASSVLARDIKDSRHELGFHGYNHFSLWKQDWQNREFMESSLEAAKKRWNIDNLGSFPVTYVPPTNNIDSTGLAALKEALPSIKYMSSLYLGDVEQGGGREFGPDPIVPDLFAYPRISSGFVNNDISNFDQQSLFLYSGIWTHFIHPDDVFQVTQLDEDNYKSRNPLGLGWHSNEVFDYGLYEVFEQRLRETKQRYPIIRFSAAREAVPIVQKWLQTQSVYTIDDEDMSIATSSFGSGNEKKFWLNYVSSENQDRMENALAEADISFSKSPVWDGALYQFNTTTDTLKLPVFRSKETDDVITEKIVKEHKTRMATVNREEASTVAWRDTRLEDVLSALQENPNKKELQDSLISLAVELDTVQLAIPILEERLADSLSNKEDAEQLFQLYGWQQESKRAFEFVDSLWKEHQNEQVLNYQKQMANLFGIPDEEFEQRWLNRRLRIHPGDAETLQRLVYLSDSWEQKEDYLKDLLFAHPETDSLFAFIAEQYISNNKIEQLTEVISSSPDFEKRNFSRYAGDIAYYYASEGNMTRAGMWAAKSDSISKITELDWLIQQERYGEFIDHSEKFLAQDPSDDSLRKYVGQQLLYEDFLEKGYEILYPFFKREIAPPQIQELIQNKISYMSYPQQKYMYESYPSFFSSEQQNSIEMQHREFEGPKSGVLSRLASDNYSQKNVELGGFFEWGNRQEEVHRTSFTEQVLSTAVPELSNSYSIDLFHLNYQYQRNYENQTKQLTLGGGMFSGNGNIFPHLHAKYWWTEDNTFTSSQINFRPVFTAPAVRQKIHQINTEMYREFSWLNNTLESVLNLNASWYTDNNLSYEASTKIYFGWPISTPRRQLRPMIDLSYENTIHDNGNGLPYYTPDRLFKPGAGLNLSYKDAQYDPELSVDLELILKTGNQHANFIVSSGSVTKRFLDFWEFSLTGYLSTSEVYRYNSIELNLSYILPRR